MRPLFPLLLGLGLLLGACTERPWFIIHEMTAENVERWCRERGAGANKRECVLPCQIYIKRGASPALLAHAIRHCREGHFHPHTEG